MPKVGDIVRFNSNIPNNVYRNQLAVITDLSNPHASCPYKVRYVSIIDLTEHYETSISAEWIDGI